MVNYRLVMQLLLDSSSYRDIHARYQVSYSTISKAKKTLHQHRITTHTQLDGLSDDDLVALIGDGRVTVSGDYVDIDMDTVIAARTGRKKTPLNVLWSSYLNMPAAQGQRHYSYERFRQLVGHEVAARGRT